MGWNGSSMAWEWLEWSGNGLGKNWNGVGMSWNGLGHVGMLRGDFELVRNGVGRGVELFIMVLCMV